MRCGCEGMERERKCSIILVANNMQCRGKGGKNKKPPALVNPSPRHIQERAVIDPFFFSLLQVRHRSLQQREQKYIMRSISNAPFQSFWDSFSPQFHFFDEVTERGKRRNKRRLFGAPPTLRLLCAGENQRRGRKEPPAPPAKRRERERS